MLLFTIGVLYLPIHSSIHEFMFYTTYLPRLRESWRQSQLTSGKSHGTPWAGCQSIAGITQQDKQAFMLAFTPINNLEKLVDQICCFGLWEETGVPKGNLCRHS